MNEIRLRKLTADLVFDGKSLHTGAVLVMEEDGTVADLLFPRNGRDAGTEYYEGLLTPGFINAHCHLELSHMKGLVPKGGGLVDFILQLQRLRRFPEEQVISAMQKAEKEMLDGGIVAVGDISNSGVSFPVKRHSRLLYHTFLEVFGFDPQKAESIFSGARALRAADTSGCASCIVPHAPYSVSENLFRIIGEQAMPDSAFPLFSIHNQESAHEDPFYRDGTGDLNRLYREFGIDISFYQPYGRSALPTWFPWLGTSGMSPKPGMLRNTGSAGNPGMRATRPAPGRTLLVHNTYTTREDVEWAVQQGDIWWCLCPGANLYIEDRLPDVPMFMEKGLRLVLGTDSLASNDCLSILEEMKLLSRHFPEIGLEQLLQWATRSGAAFFGWDQLGTFEKGKKPGVNLITGLNGRKLGESTGVRQLMPAGLPLGSHQKDNEKAS